MADGDTFFNPNPESNPGDVFQNVVAGDVWFDVQSDSFLHTAWDTLNVFLQTMAWDILNDNQRDTAWDILNTVTLNLAWDILNEFAQATSWDILNQIDQDTTWAILNGYTVDTAWDSIRDSSQATAWSVFAQTLYFLQEIFIKQVCFDYYALTGEVLDETIDIVESIPFDHRIEAPLNFTFNVSKVHPSIVEDDILIKEPTEFNFQIMEPLTFTFYVQNVFPSGTDEFEKRN